METDLYLELHDFHVKDTKMSFTSMRQNY